MLAGSNTAALVINCTRIHCMLCVYRIKKINVFTRGVLPVIDSQAHAVINSEISF